MFNFAKELFTNSSCARHARIYGSAIALVLATSQIVTISAYADDLTRELERQEIRQINREIQELQTKVKEIEARVIAEAGSTSVQVNESRAPATVLSNGEEPPPTPPSPVQESREDQIVSGVKLHLFGDVGYVASDEKGKTNSFRHGALDLFLTGALTEHVSVLGEVLFVPGLDNTVGIDLERILFQYKRNDYFNFAIGRYHTSIGYYNTAFHQGSWFQTAIESPFIYAFDDQGGFLPLQEVGMTANGEIPSGKLGLYYVAEIGNGQSHMPGTDPVQSFRDTNIGKSFNFALYARPSWLPGLQAGVSLYHDHITFMDNDNQDELISTVHIVYTNSNYEFLNEGLLVRHVGTDAALARVFHTPGFYTQFSRRFGKYRPYFRYAYVNAGVAEPIYGDSSGGVLVGRRNGPTFGLRYDLNDHSAFKLQYDRHAQRGQKDFNTLESQFSFAF